jgi:di/tricarboxylate transporter
MDLYGSIRKKTGECAMTLDIFIFLTILLIAIVLFIIEWIRMDVVALLVLGSLAVAGLVTPSEALSGFSNPAVVTVWAVLILSGGLARTGLAGQIGRVCCSWRGIVKSDCWLSSC